jgi:hypothetical protein
MSQKTTFFMDTAIKTLDLTINVEVYQNENLRSNIVQRRRDC